MKSKSAYRLVRTGSRLFAIAIVALLAAQAARSATLYWDTNGTLTTAYSATGAWNWNGSTGTANWNSDPLGGGAGTFFNQTTAADNLHFSAPNSTGVPTITLTGTQLANSITFDFPPGTALAHDYTEDKVVITGGQIDIGGGANSGIFAAPVPTGIATAGYTVTNSIASTVNLVSAATFGNDGITTMEFKGTVQGAYDLTLKNNASSDFGVVLIGGVNLTGGSKITNQGSGGGIAQITGVIAGTDVSIVQDSATSALWLGNAGNAFTGNVVLKQGMLVCGDTSNVLGNTGNSILFNGGILASAPGKTLADYSARFANSSTGDYKINLAGSTTTFVTSLSRTGVGLHKYGIGTLILSAAAAYDGTTILGGIDVPGMQTAGGGTLRIGTSLNGTLGTALEFRGTSTFDVAEAAGIHQGMQALTFTVGDGTVQSTYAGVVGTDTSLLSFSGYSRAAGAAANFVVTQGTGGVNGTDNKIVLAGVMQDALMDGAYFNGGATGGASFAWYDGSVLGGDGFVRGIVYGGDDSTVSTGAAVTLSSAFGDHQQVTGAVSAQASDAFASLNIRNTVNAALPVVDNQAFTLAAGATVRTNNLLVSGGANTGTMVTISGGTAFRPAATNDEIVIRTDVTHDRLVITNFLRDGTNVLTKSGAGTLVLAGTNTMGGNGITGNIRINQGTLLIDSAIDTTYGGQINGAGVFAITGPGKVTLNGSSQMNWTGGTVLNGTLVVDFTHMSDPTNMIPEGIPGTKGTGTGTGVIFLGGSTGTVERGVKANGTIVIMGKPGAYSTVQQLGASGMFGSGTNVNVSNGVGRILVDPNGGRDTTVVLGQVGVSDGSILVIGKSAGAGTGNAFFQAKINSNNGPTGAYGGAWGKLYYTADGAINDLDFVVGTHYDNNNNPCNWMPVGTAGTSYNALNGGGFEKITGAQIATAGGTVTKAGDSTGLKIQDPQDAQVMTLSGAPKMGVSGLIMTGSNSGNFTISGGSISGASTGYTNRFPIIQMNPNMTLTISSVISLRTTTNDYLSKNGQGTVILAGANTYSSDSSCTYINEGTLQAGSAETSGVSGPFGKRTATGAIRFAGGTLQYSAVNNFDYSGRFATDGNEPVKIDTNGRDVTFAVGVRGAASALTKLGAGTLTLANTTNAATYTGLTTVSGGTLKVASTANINTTSGVNIGAGNFNYSSATALSQPVVFTSTGGTLSGSGTITPKVSVTSGNSLSPGDGVGILSLSNGLTIAPSGIFNWGNSTLNTYGTAGIDWSVANVTGATTISSTPGSGSLLKLQFTDPATSFSNPYWNSSLSWNIVTGGVTTGNLFDASNISVFVNAGPVGSGNTISGQGAFSTIVSGSNLDLVWTPSIGGSGNDSQILITSAPGSSSIVTGASAKTIAFSRVLVGSTQTTGTLTLGNSGSDTAPYTVATSSDVAATTFANGAMVGSGSASGTITLSTAAVGSKSGTLTVTNTSPDSLGGGLGSADANDVFTVTGTVVATRTVNAPTPTALGTFHAGATVNVPSNIFGYSYGTGGTGAHSDTEDTTVQAYAGAADGNGITLTGGPNSVNSAAGFTRSFTGTAAVNTSGGSFTSTVNPEFSAATTVNAAYTIGVYSGNMEWIGATGNWGTNSNWTDLTSGGAQVAPGKDSGFTGVDKATFGATGTNTVTVDAPANLNRLTFDGDGNYTLTGSSSLSLAGTSAAINVTSGTQQIAAPVTLANNVAVTVTAGSLAIGGKISGGGSATLTKGGGGILELSNSNNDYSGNTNVNGGTLRINGANTGAGSVTVGALGTLEGSGAITGPLNVTGILSPGGASLESLASGNLALTSGSFFNYQVDSSVAHSVGADLQKVTGTLDLIGTVNLTLTDFATLDTAFAANTKFSLFNYTGLLTGQLSYNSVSLTDGAAFTDAGWLNTWVIDYNAPTGGANFNTEYAGGADSFINIIAASYSTWAAGWSSPALSNQAVDADPDNDGLDNALEYVIGSDPRVANQGRPGGGVVGTNLVLSFTRKDSSETSDVALRVEVSTNLTDWTTIPAYIVGKDTASSTSGVVVTEAGTSDDSITVTIPKGTDLKKFARVKVIITP